MNTDRAAAGLEALSSFSTEEPQHIEAVFQRVADGCREVLALCCSTKTLVLTADPDDDTVTVQCLERADLDTTDLECASAQAPWRDLLGQSLEWGWVTINQQGYCDGVLLAIGGLTPTLLLNVVASTLLVARVEEVREKRT